jgi:hypothetical protein
MFIVEAMIKEDFDLAIELISKHSNFSYTMGKDRYTFIINVNADDGKNRLCEIEFENNWHQKHSAVCRICEQKGEIFCNHKTFSRPIRASFF